MTLNIDNMSAKELLAMIADDVYQGKSLSGKDALIPQLIKRALETALNAEADIHVSETKLEEQNRKNGKSKKTVTSSFGTFELETPRDRNGSFEPQIVKKRQTVITEEIDKKVLRLYTCGLGYEDISLEIASLYGIELSNAQISVITDRILQDVTEFRSRPLDKCYVVIFLDAMFFKTKQDGSVKTSVLYNIMGITETGHKEILGFYTCQSEGASFWLGVLNDLKNRGVEDILIACVDGLKGFPEAINTAFPKTEVQLCVVHQIRNSIKCVASKDQKAFISDLKEVYQAPNKQVAEDNLHILNEKWAKYSAAIRPWYSHWEHLSTYFKFSENIRKLIYTTNPIEGFHRQIRKITKTKGAFTSENALIKLVFCCIMRIQEKWTSPIPNWALSLSELDIHFPNRLPSLS